MKRHGPFAFAFLVALLLFLASFTGWAQPPGFPLDRIARDFSMIAGYVVDQTGEEYVIDLDASQGIAVGDLFTIRSPGKELVHPVTGKVLGRLEKVKAVLAVTRLEKGYSFARLLPGSGEPRRGDPIGRYGKMHAVFWDYTGKGRDLHRRLARALPHIRWVDYASAQAARPPRPAPPKGKEEGALVFVLLENGLEVRDPDFQVIHTYQIPSRGAGQGAAEASSPPPRSARKGPTRAFSEGAGPVVEYKETFPALKTLATLPGPTLMADFVDTPRGKFMASTDGKTITLSLVKPHGLERVATYLPPDPGDILSLGWWRPQAGGPLYLAYNAWREPGLQGGILVLEQDRFRAVHTKIPHLLGTFDADSDGTPETLLAQERDREEFFGHRRWQGKIRQGGLSWSRPELDLPRNFNVTGSALADLVGDEKPEMAFILNGHLYIYGGGKALFKSSVRVGGSAAVLVYDLNTSPQNPMSSSAVFEIRPRALDLDGDGRNELIVPATAREGLGSVSPSIAGEGLSTLVVFKYRDGRFVHGTLGDAVSGHLQGLDVSPDRVLMVLSQEGPIFQGGGKSALVRFDLKRP